MGFFLGVTFALAAIILAAIAAAYWLAGAICDWIERNRG